MINASGDDCYQIVDIDTLQIIARGEAIDKIE